MKNLGLFNDHLVYFTAIGNIYWPFRIFCGDLVYFPCFDIFYQEKIWQPCNLVALISTQSPINLVSLEL
jgi:hypothetical protein